jgi:hypothetical protein
VSDGLAGPADPTPTAIAIVGKKVQTYRERKAREKAVEKSDAVSIVLDCIVKLPEDPTDNPGLCRGFKMEMVADEGTISKFRFGTDARYRFSPKSGRKYRVRAVVGANWEVTVTPDRELEVGERAQVVLRQKE